MAAARKDAESALTGAIAALADARAKLKAETGRVPAATLADARSRIALAEKGVQEARTASSGGNYKAAIGQGIFCHFAGHRRARTDQRHVTDQHVVKLWQLVERKLS